MAVIVKYHPTNVQQTRNVKYKPDNYNSLSPYLIIDNAQKLANLLKMIFSATKLLRFDHNDGTISHIQGTPDTRGAFRDFAGKYRPVSTQTLQ